jgi:hypothetical protein
MPPETTAPPLPETALPVPVIPLTPAKCWNVSNCQSTAPLAAENARSLPSQLPSYTTPGLAVTAGVNASLQSVGNCAAPPVLQPSGGFGVDQIVAPVAGSSANSVPGSACQVAMYSRCPS